MKARMNIGQAAAHSGVHAKMIRHYETLGLLPRVRRTEAGYRIYDESDIHTLRFIRRARDLGFPTAEIKKLLGLWRNRERASAEVKALAQAHVRRLDEKIAELKSMRDALTRLSRSCHGDHRPVCPILSDLAEEA